jgi:imidazolonepropionase-like amidohydrolase
MHQFFVALGLAAAALPAAAETYALNCGEVFDSKSARMVGARTLVTADGRISQVLPGGTPVPGATTVDLSGQTCMPGWMDLHVHLGQQSSPQSYTERLRLDDVDFAFRSVRPARPRA